MYIEFKYSINGEEAFKRLEMEPEYVKSLLEQGIYESVIIRILADALNKIKDEYEKEKA